MTRYKQTLGRWGEEQAARYLAEKGYCILTRNYRTAYGELDIVAIQNEGIVFVEVKTRASTAYGLPEDSVTARKQTHLLNAALAYLQDHPEFEGGWRIDVVAIQKSPSGQPQIVHFENAVTG